MPRWWRGDFLLNELRIKRDKLRESLKKFEIENERDFFLASQTIVHIANQEEKNLYLFKLGKRLEKNRTDELNAVVNRLKQLEQEKRSLENAGHKFDRDANTKKIIHENLHEIKVRDELGPIQDALRKIKVANPNANGYDELSRFYDQ